jgi:peptide chain release factor 1
MEEHFTRLLARLEELTISASQPETIADQPRFSALMKEMSTLEPQAAVWRQYGSLQGEIASVSELLSQPEMKRMAEEELRALEEKKNALEGELRALLLPKDEDDERDVVMEIRAGTGGEEAALFSAQLLRMYTRFAERHGFEVTLLSLSDSDLGGVKEAVFTIKGRGAFSRLKYESGAHCVKRVPVTESGGRLHTSTATVAVLPAWEDAEVDIAPGDIRVDVYRSSGHGGQSVNTTDSAVRITHLPSGLVVTCQNEKSQIKNREQAMKVLRIRLYDRARAEKDQEYAKKRKGLVGSGERSEKIRTYHFLQGRVTDHRIGLTLYQVETAMDGDLDQIIDALASHEHIQQMGAQSA